MRLIFLLLAFAFITLPLQADYSVLTDSRQNWPEMVEKLHKDLTGNAAKDLNAFKSRVIAMLASYTDMCDQAEKRNSELNFLLWDQPEETILGISISVYNKQITDLDIFFNQKLRRITMGNNYLSSEVERFYKLKALLEQVNPRYFTAEQLKKKLVCQQILAQTIVELEQLAKMVNGKLEKAQKIQADINKVKNAGKERNEKVFWKMLLTPQTNIIACYPFLGISFGYWLRDIPWNLDIQTPDEYDFWVKLMLLAVIGGTLFMHLGGGLNRKAKKLGLISENKSNARILKTGWIFLGMALLMLGTCFWTTVIEYSFFCRFAMIFLSISFLLFTLEIRIKPELYKGVFMLYLPLLLLYIFGSMLWTTVITFRPLIVIWTFANIPVVIATIYILVKYKLPPLDRCLGVATVLFALISSGMSACGYAFMATTAMMIWFLAAIGIQAGISLTAMAYRFNPETTAQRIAASFIFMILVPLIWITVVGGLIYWTAIQFNIQNILENFMARNLCPADIQGIQISLWDIVCSISSALILFFVISTIKNIIRLFYQEKADTGLLASFLTLGTYLIWFGYIIFMMMLFHVSPNSILVVLGGMSVGLGLGLRDIIENFICGIILLVGKSVRPGDVIEFDDTWGLVQKISIRSTVVKTFDDAVINLPNSVVVSKNFRNWTLTGHIIRRDIKVGVMYGSDVAKVKRLLLEIADNEDSVMKHPAPNVLFMDFGASELQFTLRVWFKDLRKHTDSSSRMREEINRVFNENGIVIAYPQLDVHMDMPGIKAIEMK